LACSTVFKGRLSLTISLGSLLQTASIWESDIPRVLYRGNTWPEQHERMDSRGKSHPDPQLGPIWRNNAMITHAFYGERAVP